MYYLHLLDGSRCHRDTLIWVGQEAQAPVVEHNIGGSPLVSTDSAVQTYDARWTLGPVASDIEAQTLAVTIAGRYNYKVAFGNRILESADFARETISNAAAALGSSKSEKKTAAARRNSTKPPRPGKKPRGRPRKSE